MDDVQLRVATPADRAALTAAFGDLRDFPLDVHPDEGIPLLALLRTPRGEQVIAKAYLRAANFDEYEIAPGLSGLLGLYGLAIAPEFRNRGYGSDVFALIEGFVGRQRSKTGVFHDVLAFGVDDGNPAVHRFYDRRNYRRPPLYPRFDDQSRPLPPTRITGGSYHIRIGHVDRLNGPIRPMYRHRVYNTPEHRRNATIAEGLPIDTWRGWLFETARRAYTYGGIFPGRIHHHDDGTITVGPSNVPERIETEYWIADAAETLSRLTGVSQETADAEIRYLEPASSHETGLLLAASGFESALAAEARQFGTPLRPFNYAYSVLKTTDEPAFNRSSTLFHSAQFPRDIHRVIEPNHGYIGASYRAPQVVLRHPAVRKPFIVPVADFAAAVARFEAYNRWGAPPRPITILTTDRRRERHQLHHALSSLLDFPINVRPFPQRPRLPLR